MQDNKTDRVSATPTGQKPYVKPNLKKREKLTEIAEGDFPVVVGTAGAVP